jgi:C-terminal processing protease CtpA/Prc
MATSDKSEVRVPPKGAKSCSGTFYAGIGILTNDVADSVVSVAAGSPAEKVGIKLDDIILNRQNFLPDIHKVGDHTEVKLIRDGHIMTIPVTIAKICSVN